MNGLKVKMVAIAVRDQNAALEFYTKKLGFKILTDTPMGDDQRWLEVKAPGNELSIALFTSPGQEVMIGKFSNITFSCSNLEQTYQDLKSKGVEFEKQPTKEEWGSYAIFKDPDGNSFCLSKN